ncbi:MAG: DNA-binding response regulator, partial [Gammaproteobacteria bacterium]|nr:DNA-binding response regulator [Gammaproteobacteria bacterium]
RMGADDYLAKTISLPHLTARVAALFRRAEALTSGGEESEEQVQVGHLEVDARRLTCNWMEKPVDLTLTEFWMVYALAKRAGHVKNRDQLMQESKLVIDENTVTSHIKRIRRKFREVDTEFNRIDTVYGMGYRWLGDS